MKRTEPCPSSAGSLTNRSSCCGMGMRAFMLPPSFRRFSSRQMMKPRFGMKGNGCAGSMAIGVTTGRICSRKRWSSQDFSCGNRSVPSVMTMPFWASSRVRWIHRRSCSAISSCARARTRSSCSWAERPSSLSWVSFSRTWPTRPATRTMKNSSRLLPEIDRKRRRSSSGWAVLRASSSTRMLKPSHEISRLMKRCVSWAVMASGMGSCSFMSPFRSTVAGRHYNRLMTVG